MNRWRTRVFNWSIKLSYGCLGIACVFIALPLQAESLVSPLSTVLLSINNYRISAEIARSAGEREKGLMYRESLPADQGMLFVFDQTDVRCFWMRNTFIPLSVAFINQAGQIVNIEDMQPHTSQAHCSQGPVRYALEMNQGWFAQHHVPVNTIITHLP